MNNIQEAHLISQPLRGDNGDLVTYSLVGLEVEGEFGVVAFDDHFGRLLYRLQIASEASASPQIMFIVKSPSSSAITHLCTDTTHLDGL